MSKKAKQKKYIYPQTKNVYIYTHTHVSIPFSPFPPWGFIYDSFETKEKKNYDRNDYEHGNVKEFLEK